MFSKTFRLFRPTHLLKPYLSGFNRRFSTIKDPGELPVSLEKPSMYKESRKETWSFKTLCFKSTTFRGKEALDPQNNLIDLLINPKRYRMAFRDMEDIEANNELNRDIMGLVGQRSWDIEASQRPSVAKVTEETETKHRSGTGLGIFSMPKLKQELAFYFSLPESKGSIVIDHANIPSSERRVDSHKTGILVNSVHASAVIMRLIRKDSHLTAEYNPLYVDQEMLTGALKKDYQHLLVNFHEISSLIKQNPDPEKIEKYQEQQRAFYSKLAEHLQFESSHEKAILDEINPAAVMGYHHP